MKITQKLLWIGVLSCVFLWVSFWNQNWFPWFSLNFQDFSDTMSDKFSEIHFWFNWTDYWGALFVTEFKDANETISIAWTSNTVTCEKKLRWYYWNPIRWSMVFPLSQEDLTYWKNAPHNAYDNITLDWWFYSDCLWYTNSIIWQVNYYYKWERLFSIVVWRKASSRWLVDWNQWFANSFQLYQWVTPIGLLFDSTLWLWMVWAHIVTWSNLNYVTWATSYTQWFWTVVDRINNWNGVNKFVSSIKDWIVDFKNWTSEIKWRRWDVTAFIASSVVWVLWWYNLGLGAVTSNENYVSNVQKMWSLTDNWWWYDQRAYYIWSQNELSKRLNTLRKNSEELCKWRWISLNSATDITIWTSASNLREWELNCFDSSNTDQEIKILLDQDLTLNWKETTIVTKWGEFNMIITKNQVNNWHINVFIDWWILSILDSAGTWNLVYMNWDWEYSSSANVAMWSIIKWNFDINWLIWGWKSWSMATSAEAWFWAYSHKLYIHWSMSSLNTIEEAKSERISLIDELLSDLFNSNPVYSSIINLKYTFTRRCEDATAKWTDGAPCSVMATDKWAHNSLVVINKNYQNPLMK